MFAMPNDSCSVFRAHHRSPYLRVILLVLVVHLLIFALSPPFQFQPYRLPPEESMIIEKIHDYDVPPVPKDIPVPKTFVGVSEDEPDNGEYPPTVFDSVDDFPPRAAVSDEDPVDFCPFDEPPTPLHFEAPAYPALAREAGIEGIVQVIVVIDANGEVVEATVLTSNVTQSMEQAALEAARKCRFEPAKQWDVPVPVKVVIPFEFRLVQ